MCARLLTALAFAFALTALGCGRSAASLDERASEAAVDAGLPDHLQATVFDASVPLPYRSLTVLEKCGSPDAGTSTDCVPAAIAISLATTPTCDSPTSEYWSAIATFGRWTPGLYQIGSMDPVTVSFVHQQAGTYWPEQHYATEGSLDLIECDLESGACAGWANVSSAYGDAIRGPFATSISCARRQTP